MLGILPTATKIRLPLQQTGRSTKAQISLQRLSCQYDRALRIFMAAVDRGRGRWARLSGDPGPSASGTIERPHQASPSRRVRQVEVIPCPELALYNLETMTTAVLQKNSLVTPSLRRPPPAGTS